MRVMNRHSITSTVIEFIQPAKSEHSELVYTPAVLAIGENFANGPSSYINTSARVSVSWDLVQLFGHSTEKQQNFWPKSTTKGLQELCVDSVEALDLRLSKVNKGYSGPLREEVKSHKSYKKPVKMPLTKSFKATLT